MGQIVSIAQLVAAVAVVIGIWFAYLQLQRISSSLQLMQQSNTANVVAHCASRYERIVSDLPQDPNDPEVDKWWYRYWDLYTEQFTFFQKAMLDRDVFELWINELATVYGKRPAPEFERRDEKHQNYLVGTLPNYKVLHNFFDELRRIANTEEAGPEERARQVHNLIERYAPDTESMAFLPDKTIQRTGAPSR